MLTVGGVIAEVVPRSTAEGVIRVTFAPWAGRFWACVLFGKLSGALLLNPGLVVRFPGFAVPWLVALNPGEPPRTAGDPTTRGEVTRLPTILPPLALVTGLITDTVLFTGWTTWLVITKGCLLKMI